MCNHDWAASQSSRDKGLGSCKRIEGEDPFEVHRVLSVSGPLNSSSSASCVVSKWATEL